MLSLNQGDIVFANFPLEEEKSSFTKRPCLILAVDEENERFLAAKITTTELNRSWAVHIRAGNSDMNKGYLRMDSWINLNRREWLPFSELIFYIGSIKNDILDNIIHQLTS